ncbi:MAG: DUF4373 domain-containing protein [Planktothrix sp.]
MKKDAYYFSHDANSQDDPKCVMLVEALGMEGYGIFWALIERMRSEQGFKLPYVILPALARRWNSSKEKIDVVIKNFGLFELENDHFYSKRLIRSMETFNEFRAKLSNSGKAGAEKRWAGHSHPIATLSPGHSHPIALKKSKEKESKEKESKEKESKEKESKEKESKEKEIKKAFTPPTIKEVSEYTNERGTGIDPDGFFDFYQSKGWRVGAQPMKDWRAAVRTWERRDSGGNNSSGVQLSKKGQDTLRIMQNVDAYLEGGKNANA